MTFTLLPPPVLLTGPPVGPPQPAPGRIVDRITNAVNHACADRVPRRYPIATGVVLIASYRTTVMPLGANLTHLDDDEVELFTVELESNARQLARVDVDTMFSELAAAHVVDLLVRKAETRINAMRKVLRFWDAA